MALNFGLLDPNAPATIANSVTQGQQMAQQEKLGQMRMESAQLDLDKVKREAAGLQRMQQLFMENGKSPDMRTNFSEMIKSGIPHFMDIGYNGLKALDEQDRYQEFVRKSQPANAMAAPTESIMRQPMAAAPTQNALGSGTYGLEPTAAPVNAMAARAPVATPAPVNAMATQDRAAQIQRRMMELSAFPNIPAAKTELKVLEKELEEAVKIPTDIATMKALGYPTTTAGYTAFRDAQRQDRLLSPEELKQKMLIANAGAARSTTNVNTQIPASEEAQKEFMKEARVTFNTLKSAPSILTNMEEAKKLVPSAKGFMGPGGEPMLKAASFLNNRLGTNIATEGITDASVLRSRLFTGVIENLRKLDAQPTQSQQQVLQDAIGNLGTDPNALPRVLDAFGDILREKVGAYNAEVKDAEAKGVKFPYNPVIKLPEPKRPAADQIPGQGTPAPAAGGNTVSLPDGRVMTFPNAAAAAEFKKAARL